MYIRSIDRNDNRVEIELQDSDFLAENISKEIFTKEMINKAISKETFFDKYKDFFDNMIDRSYAMIFGDDMIYTAAYEVGECNHQIVIEIYYREGIDERMLTELDESELEDYLTEKRNLYIVNIPRLGNAEKLLELIGNLEIVSSSLSKDYDSYYLTIKTARKISIDYILLRARIREFANLVDEKKGMPLIPNNAVEKLRIIFEKE